MAKPLVVWGITTFVAGVDGQWRFIAAVKSRAEFCRLLDEKPYYVRDYGCPTGNKEEIAFAMQHPHKLIAWKPCRHQFVPESEWRKVL